MEVISFSAKEHGKSLGYVSLFLHYNIFFFYASIINEHDNLDDPLHNRCNHGEI